MSPVRQTVDLLCPEPETRIRLSTLERALGYAFSAGDTSGIFERALEHATPSGSTFEPSCFTGDLFLEQFLERCLPGPDGPVLSRAGKAYVKSVLCAPPREARTVAFRQAILRELSTDAPLRERFERVHAEMHELRALLQASDAGVRYDIAQRRLDVLRSLASVFTQLAEGFSNCTSELRRLGAFGTATKNGEGFRKLAELLDFEENVATMDVRVRLGLDGKVRGFELLEHVENKRTRFYKSWLGRLWLKLWMALRGYRVTHGEISMRLTDHVFEGLQAEVLQLFQVLGDMDFYRAGLALYRLAETQGLAVSLPTFDPEQGFRLSRLFNPFLVAEGVRVRACDIERTTAHGMTIITGPNSGGKTRLLQAIGLSQLLGQSGLPVPAGAANLGFSRGMFVSIVQEVSPEQREGRLGTELLRIRHLFERISPGDVIVLDELCSGTNPSEGEEIFRLVIELLSELEPQLWLTTHFLQFADRLRAEAMLKSLSFLQVELDSADHPTFAFVPGVAKSSLAGQAAERLGVTWKELSALVEQAKRRGEA